MRRKRKNNVTHKPTGPQPTPVKTRHYEPFHRRWFNQPRDLPVFTFATIYAMQIDPQIRLCLAMRKAPIYDVEIAHKNGTDEQGKPKWVPGVECRDPAVGAWVQRQLDKIWSRYLPKLLSAQTWGWSGGEITLKLSEHNLIEIDELHSRHAGDVVLLKRDGDRCGIRVRRVKNTGNVDLEFPYSWFHSFNADDGEDYGNPILLGAYSPWADKWLNGGALDTRRLYMHKDAYGGMRVGYPEEVMQIDGTDQLVSARDIALQIAEQRAAGGVITYPSTKDHNGHPKWLIEEATVTANPGHILQFPKDLDDEIRHGMEIPDDVINSDQAGGWAGKRVTLAAFYSGLNDWVTQIFCDLRQTLDPLILMNWGRAIDYNIDFKPLGQAAMEQQAGAGGFQAGAGGFQAQQPQGMGGMDLGGSMPPIRMSAAKEGKEGKDNPAEQAQLIAEILTHLYGEDAEAHFDQMFGDGAIKRMAVWNPIEHPRGPNGRFIAKNSPEAVAAAKTQVKQALGGKRNAASLKSVIENLSILTTKQLREVKQEYGIKAGGVKQSLIDKIANRLHGVPIESEESEETEARGTAQGAELRDDETPVDPSNKDVYTVPTGSLKVDPKRFQYKVKGVGADGVTNELKGVSKWNPELGGALLVWRDPETGEDFVVNGHHRFELASRLGAENLNVRYLDSPDATKARASGALANIAEGRGTALDAAKYLRDSKQDIEHLKKAGISMSGKVAADALILKDLANEPFQQVTQGMIDEDKAIAVARHLKDHDLQNQLFKKLKKRDENDDREWSNREIEAAARKLNNAGKITKEDTDLFGSFFSEESTFDQEVELESHVSRLLSQQANDYRAVANKRRAERVESAGNVLAVDENARRADQAEILADSFQREAHLKGPVSAAVKEMAAELAGAKTRKQRDEIKSRAYEKIQSELGALDNPQAAQQDDPQDGDRNERGLVFRDGRWRRDGQTTKLVEAATLRDAKDNYESHRQRYIEQHGRVNEAGELEGVVLNTDDWRNNFAQYVGTNAADVHEASSELNKKLYAEALDSLKGKGNNRMLILAGGGGSGKGTATRDHLDQSKYPITLDQASDNYPKLEAKLDEAIAAGFTPEHVFIDRPAEAAFLDGVIARAMNSLSRGDVARTVPFMIASHANIKSREATLELLKRRDDIDAKVIDNRSEKRGSSKLIDDRQEAIAYLEQRVSEEKEAIGGLEDKVKAMVAHALKSEQMPEDVAEGLLGPEFVESVKSGEYQGPQDGDRDQSGLVFREGRWRREATKEATPGASQKGLFGEDFEPGRYSATEMAELTGESSATPVTPLPREQRQESLFDMGRKSDLPGPELLFEDAGGAPRMVETPAEVETPEAAPEPAKPSKPDKRWPEDLEHTTPTAPGISHSEIPLEAAYRAHTGTSFSPERRARQEQDGYVSAMNNAYAQILTWADGDPAKALPEFERYKAGYRDKYMAYLNSRSGIVSTMIAGPSNFNVRRAEKANNATHNKLLAIGEFEKKAMKAVLKNLRPQDVEKKIGDVGKGDDIRANIERREADQERFKKTNAGVRKIIKKHSISRENGPSPEAVAELAQLAGISEAAAKGALTYERGYGYGVAQFELTNNNANIRRLKQQLASQERFERQSQEAAQGDRKTEFQFEGGNVFLNYEENRLQIKHDQKPDRETIDKLKRNGFRWSPRDKVWQRQLTANAKSAAQEILGRIFD